MSKLQPPRMELRELAERWGSEICKDGRQLAVAILDAATTFGEFDDLPKNQRLVIIDSDSFKIEPFGKGPFIDNMRNMARRLNSERGAMHWEKDSFVWAWIKVGSFHVHQNAIAIFAERREFPMPSWWANGLEGKAARSITVKALTRILERIALAGEPLKESEMRERVMADPEVTGKKVTRDAWRQAVKALPDCARRGRGQTDKAVIKASTLNPPSNRRR